MQHDNDGSAKRTKQQRITLEKAEEKRLRRGVMRVERSVLKPEGAISEKEEFLRIARVYSSVLSGNSVRQDNSWLLDFAYAK